MLSARTAIGHDEKGEDSDQVENKEESGDEENRWLMKTVLRMRTL